MTFEILDSGGGSIGGGCGSNAGSESAITQNVGDDSPAPPAPPARLADWARYRERYANPSVMDTDLPDGIFKVCLILIIHYFRIIYVFFICEYILSRMDNGVAEKLFFYNEISDVSIRNTLIMEDYCYPENLLFQVLMLEIIQTKCYEEQLQDHQTKMTILVRYQINVKNFKKTMPLKVSLRAKICPI